MKYLIVRKAYLFSHSNVLYIIDDKKPYERFEILGLGKQYEDDWKKTQFEHNRDFIDDLQDVEIGNRLKHDRRNYRLVDKWED